MNISDMEIPAVTKQYIIKEVPNTLEVANPTLSHIIKNGKKKLDGGTYIQYPVKTFANQSSGSISGTNAIIDTTPSQQDVYGTLQLKYAYHSVNFTQRDYALNNGENAVIDLIQQKTEGAAQDMLQKLAKQLHGTSATNPLDWEGLKDITAASGTAYGGLLDTDFTNSIIPSADPYLSIRTTYQTLNYKNVNNMMSRVKARMLDSANFSKRVFGICNTSTHALYASSIQGQQLAVNTSDVYFSGFDGFKINGVEFYADPFCPGTQDGTTADNYLYIIPMDTLKLYVRWGSLLGEKESPFDTDVRIPNAAIKSVQFFIAANLVCNNRRLIAVNTTFVA